MDTTLRKLSESIASAVRAAEQKILQNRIGRLLKLDGRTVEINPTFVQIGNVIRDVERAFHIVRDHNAGHSQAAVVIYESTIDTVRDYRIEARCRLIIQHARGPANDGARQTNTLLHSAAQTLRHLIFLALPFP